LKNIDSLFKEEVVMAGEMNWVYSVGMGTFGALLLFLMGNRAVVPVRQKYQKGKRK
jgi:hypothetical protein